MKTSILILFTKFKTGGAEKEALSLLTHLDKRKFEVTLVCFSATLHLIDKLKELNTVKIFNQSHPLFLPINIFTFCCILLRTRPVIVLSMMGRSSLIASISRLITGSTSKLLIWHHIHFSSWIENGCYSDSNKILIIVQRAIIRFVYPISDRVLTIIEAAKNDLVTTYKIEPDKITVVPSMINVSEITELATKKPLFPLSNSKVKLIYVGRLVPGKGADTAIYAFKKIRKLFPSSILFIVGVGHLKDKLIFLAKRLGLSKEVKFLGYIENPYPLIKSCNAAILPFTAEGRPHAILEAMVLKTPVVTTDFPGYQECVCHKVTGLVCEKKDVDCLVSSISAIVSHKKLRQSLVKSAYKFAQQFDSRIVSRKYKRVFEQVLN